MERVIYIDNVYGTKDKYILRKEYEGFGIYNEKTSTGFFVHQEWLITNGDVLLVVPSYSQVCQEELLDLIDNFNECGKFGIKAIAQGCKKYIVHLSGGMV